MKTTDPSSYAGLIAIFFALVPSTGAVAKDFPANVYMTASEAPKPTSSPQKVPLKTPGGTISAIRVQASLMDIRLSHNTSRGLTFTGAASEWRKFVRLDLAALGAANRPARMVARYSVKQGKGPLTPHTETVEIRQESTSLVVDLAGIIVQAGSSVESKTSFRGTTSTTTATKTSYAKSEIVALEVTITDNTGKVLFFGGWPDEPK